jgi:hypothetical protein
LSGRAQKTQALLRDLYAAFNARDVDAGASAAGTTSAVHQLVRALDGAVIADREVTHVYSLRDGLIARMDVSESPG